MRIHLTRCDGIPHKNNTTKCNKAFCDNIWFVAQRKNEGFSVFREILQGTVTVALNMFILCPLIQPIAWDSSIPHQSTTTTITTITSPPSHHHRAWHERKSYSAAVLFHCLPYPQTCYKVCTCENVHPYPGILCNCMSVLAGCHGGLKSISSGQRNEHCVAKVFWDTMLIFCWHHDNGRSKD